MWSGDLTVRRVRVLLDGLMWMPDSTVRRRIAAEQKSAPKPAPKSATQDVRAFFGGGAKFTGGG